MMNTHARFLGTTTRDLVFLVQDGGLDAAAAKAQLLASHATLIKSAARQFPALAGGERIAREAFLKSIRGFAFSANPGLSTYCRSAMRSALEEALRVKTQPVQIPLFEDAGVPVTVPITQSDLQMLLKIARKDDEFVRAAASATHQRNVRMHAASYGLTA